VVERAVLLTDEGTSTLDDLQIGEHVVTPSGERALVV
jgi:hypothetical protein